MSDSIRQNIRGVLELFASFDAQRQYQQAVPSISVPIELCCLWADDLYHPDTVPFQQTFSEPERDALVTFNHAFERATATLPDTPRDVTAFSMAQQARELAQAAALALACLAARN